MYSERSGHVNLYPPWWSWCGSPVCYSPKAIKLLLFQYGNVSYPSTKKGCGYHLFNWFFFFFSHSFIFHTENVIQGGEDTGTLSHLNTSFVPSLRDFDLSFCTKRRFCYSQKEILYGLFSCVSQGSGIWPKNCQKNWMLQLSPYLPPHTKHWYLHSIKTSITDI